MASPRHTVGGLFGPAELIGRDVILAAPGCVTQSWCEVDEHTIDVGGTPVFYRRGPGAADVLYLHSAPTSSDDWLELLALTGGIAPDLPGFGRSGKAAHYDYSLTGYTGVIEQLLDALQLPRVTIVGHAWGAAAGLVFAQHHPERVDRLAIIDPIPLVDGFTWPGMVRWLRRPAIGELTMGSLNRRLLARLLRRGSTTPAAWPDSRIDAVWEQFDQGTQRAILRLHRSVDERSLAAAGGGLDELPHTTLVVWGDEDPWIAPSFADFYAARLPDAVAERVPGAGHWPWLDAPEVIGRLAAFVADARPE
jgi:pimeloyl-ACP methyl ester carboxylesterase